MRYLVIGAAGHAQEVAWSLQAQRAHGAGACELLFFDDGLPLGPLPSGLGRIVGDLDAIANYADGVETELVLGLGLPAIKAAVVSRLANLGLHWTTVIHPQAIIGPNVSIGEGSYIAAGAILSVNVQVGRFATINFHSLVAHGTVLEDLVTLHPDTHLSGNISVGEGCELGAGSVVIPGVTLGSWAVLGAGAVAVKPLPGRKVYVGLPAQELATSPRRERLTLGRIDPLPLPNAGRVRSQVSR